MLFITKIIYVFGLVFFSLNTSTPDDLGEQIYIIPSNNISTEISYGQNIFVPVKSFEIKADTLKVTCSTCQKYTLWQEVLKVDILLSGEIITRNAVYFEGVLYVYLWQSDQFSTAAILLISVVN